METSQITSLQEGEQFMRDKIKLIQQRLKTVVYLVVFLILLAGVTPVLADYLGPNRTVTQSGGNCKVILNRCSYVSSKNIYTYKDYDSWSCASESKPWKDYPSSGPKCTSNTVGALYWSKEDGGEPVIITYPAATIDGSLQNCSLSNGWCTTPPQLWLSASEPVAGYQVTAIEGSLNGQNFACSNSTCAVPLIEGENALMYWALSSWGDSSTMGSQTVMVDSQLPVISGAFSGTTGSNGWYVGPVSFSGSASDATSGLASFTCTLNGISLGLCNSISVNDEGSHTLVLSALDNAGNPSIVAQDISIDTQSPTLSSSLQGTLGSNSWYNDAALHATASDPVPGSGLSLLEYSIDTISWSIFPSAGVLDLPDGKHSVDVRATDNAGHSVSSSKSFQLDSVAPGILLDPQGTLGANDWYITSLKLAASVSDETSGVDIFEYSDNGGAWTTYAAPLVLMDGSHNISFWGQDKAGLVTQIDRLYKVDTVRPQIAGSLSGTPGTNGWYVSNVVLAASAVDPLPGSGVDAFTYILNQGPETPYTNALTIPDGLHTIRLNVQDKAGLIHFTDQSVKVDTIRPSLAIQTTLPNWIKDKVTLSGSAGDSGSGLSKVEISTNNGRSWQTATGTNSWSYIWDTAKDFDGVHNVIVRAVDQAGLTTEQTITTGVDNKNPTIILPASWLQWETVPLDIWDDESGLSVTRIEISDPTRRYPKRTIQFDYAQFPLSFKWDRRFGDNSIAPNGNYDVTVTAIDHMGNVAHGYASLKVLLDILPAGPTTTPQPYSRTTPTPLFTSTPLPTALSATTATAVVSMFGEIQPTAPVALTPEASLTPRATPTQTNLVEWLESVLLPRVDSTDQITELDTSVYQPARVAFPGTESGVLWGAAAAAMIGAVTSFTLEEKRKREAAAYAPEPEEDPEAALEARRAKSRAKKMKKLEAQWAQERDWEIARLTEQALDNRIKAKLTEREIEDNIDWMTLQAVTQARAEEQRHDDKLTRDEEKQSRLDTYVERQPEVTVPESNWWEKTKSFIANNVLGPWNQYVYEPIVKPGVESGNEVFTSTVSWLNSNLYQPYIAPRMDVGISKLKSDISWINETIVQPWVIPFGKEVAEVIADAMGLVSTYAIEPYVVPFVTKSVELVMEDVAWLNENLYQPHILPALEKFNEKIYQPYLAPMVSMAADGIINYTKFVTEHIYEPIFAPIVHDIDKYIVKPHVDPAVAWWDKTWDEYGEWVHNSLDAVGFIPGLGDIMDGVNGLIYLAEGHYLEASISGLAMIPVLGDLAKAGKLGLKIGTELVEEAAEKMVKEVIEEAAEQGVGKATKEIAEEGLEKAAGETTEKLAEKAAKDALENAAGKLTNETAEALLPKTLAESVTNTADKAAQKTAADIAAKAGKNEAEAIASTSTKQASKEAKEQLVQQALKQVDDETAKIIRSLESRLGDDATSINKVVALVQKYGDNAVKALRAVKPEAAAKVLRTVDESILDDVVQQGSDAFAAFSGWTEKELREHGKDLAARATKDAEVLNDVKTLVSKGPIDPHNLTDEQKFLIEKIAANSTFSADAQKVVVGKWVGLDGGFLQRAKETGSLHYSPHPDLWGLFGKLDNQNEVAWLINQKVIQTGVGKRLPFEYTLDGVPDKVLDNERDAIEAIFTENPSDNDIMQLLKSDYIPVRIRELQEISQAGYKLDFNDSIESYILSVK